MSSMLFIQRLLFSLIHDPILLMASIFSTHWTFFSFFDLPLHCSKFFFAVILCAPTITFPIRTIASPCRATLVVKSHCPRGFALQNSTLYVLHAQLSFVGALADFICTRLLLSELELCDLPQFLPSLAKLFIKRQTQMMRAPNSRNHTQPRRSGSSKSSSTSSTSPTSH